MRLLVVAGALLLPALASAEAVRAPVTAGLNAVVLGPQTVDDLYLARQAVPPTGGPGSVTSPVALTQSKVIYLNKNGATLQPGNNDSRTNRSTLATQATTIGGWNTSAANWTTTVNCMKDMFSAYDVTVTDVDPGTTPHIEALFGGSPAQLGLPANVGGVSPFTTDCSVIENAIVFTFTSVLPANDPRLICEIMAQEVAHAYGLDHELLASDPMTYLPYDGERSFKNQTASCGEDVVRQCGINGSVCRPNQNSVALLSERLGRKNGTDPGTETGPSGMITYPQANQRVRPGFDVVTFAQDDQGIESAMLYIDGQLVDTLTSGPFTFTTSSALGEGTHVLEVEFSDGSSSYTTEEVEVTVDSDAPGNGTGGGNGNNGGDDEYGGAVTGGCQSGHGAGGGALGLMFALVGLTVRRRAHA